MKRVSDHREQAPPAHARTLQNHRAPTGGDVFTSSASGCHVVEDVSPRTAIENGHTLRVATLHSLESSTSYRSASSTGSHMSRGRIAFLSGGALPV